MGFWENFWDTFCWFFTASLFLPEERTKSRVLV